METSRLLCAVLFALPLLAAENDPKALFAKHWQAAKEFTLAVAQAMPPDSYDFRPKPEEMSFADLMVHIADDNSTMCARVARTKALVKPAARDRQTVIQFMTESFDKCTREIDGLTPAQWVGEAYRFQDQPVPAHEGLLYTFTHMAHHRGQAEVYLRLNNIKPPGWRF